MRNNDCKVSIITVVRNGVETIEQTIQSVLGQTYKNIEYIIIDGLSTDGTSQIVEKYQNSTVLYISEKDNGIFDAMNKGIRYATGEIIGIINSDDWYEQDAVERAVALYEQNGADIVHGRMETVFQDGSKKRSPILPLEMIWHEMVVAHPSVFVKKSIYEKYGMFNTEYKVAADYELVLRFFCNHVKFCFIDAVMAYFRHGGFSNRNRGRMIEEHRDICLSYADLCPDKTGLMELIKKRYAKYGLSVAISDNKLLPELLRMYFGERPSEIIIFGTGVWGEKCYEGLRDGTIRVALFVDNDTSKWNQEFHGVRIVKPEDLSALDGYVLIAVKYKGEEIQQQLKSMGNRKLKCVSLRDLADIFMSWAEKNKKLLSTNS